MSLNAAALRIMQEKGLSLDDVVEIAAAMEVRSRADNTAAERQQRRRDKVKAERDASRRDVTPVTVPPYEVSSTPLVEPDGAKAPCPPFDEIAVSVWNEGPGKAGATVARRLDANRRKWLAARRREHGDQAVLDAIRNIGASPFHCGKNDRGWKANLGWVLKSPENFQKALELEPPKGVSAVPICPEQREALAELTAAKDRLPFDEWCKLRDEHFRRFPPAGQPPPRPQPSPVDNLIRQASNGMRA